ncbi:hypothetical protein [Psychrilyobacter atlanticus]|uniref:hypothetical protein n=1 Tax=Psychrilyobacter atlanticus TaxID=271091 RepID=UPI00040277F8|nr:hypothetical protein [Psychrilyobacter atlanticus]
MKKYFKTLICIFFLGSLVSIGADMAKPTHGAEFIRYENGSIGHIIKEITGDNGYLIGKGEIGDLQDFEHLSELEVLDTIYFEVYYSEGKKRFIYVREFNDIYTYIILNSRDKESLNALAIETIDLVNNFELEFL